MVSEAWSFRYTAKLWTTALLCWSLLASVQASELHIAVASNFRVPLEKIISHYPDKDDVNIILSSASSGVLYGQIIAGAPYDLFLSADSLRPQKLLSQDKGVATSLATYAIGQLALWTPGQASEMSALGRTIQRLAIANPIHAPYGIAAKCVLEEQGLWQHQQLQIITANNIAQAFQFVYSGNAPAGLVAVSHLQAHDIPEHDYRPLVSDCAQIQQQLVILTANQQAKKFVDYLLSERGREQIRSFGYHSEIPVL